jgi:hypothetical protein
MPDIITRAEGLSKGLKRFRTPGVCKVGHVDPERYVVTGACCECQRVCSRNHGRTPEGRAKKAAHYVANREVNLAKRAVYRAENANAIRTKKAAYNASPEGKAVRAAHRQTPEVKATQASYRRHRKYNIPRWLSPYISEHMATGDCPGCLVKFGRSGSTYGAVIDHDHDTGEMRMIVCSQCNTSRLRNCDDGRNPDALLLAAGRNVKWRGRVGRERAIIQVRLAALLINHYAGCSPLTTKALSIPMPGQQRYEIG